MTLQSYIRKNPQINRYFIYLLFLGLTIATSLYIFDMRIGTALKATSWVYTTPEEYAVLQFLQTYTKEGSGVFTYYRLSNQIPAFTKNTVYYGHTRLTPDSEDKQNQAILFIAGNSSISEKRSFLEKNHISYVVWGKEEELLYQNNKNPDNMVKELLKTYKIIYKNKDFIVYRTY